MDEHKNYVDFVKSELKAVPLGIAQPQMGVGAVLVKPRWSSDFRRVGTLSALCSDTEYQNEIKSELAKVETLDGPFGKETKQELIRGLWNSKSSGFLGVVVPNTAEAKAWLTSNSKVQYSLYDITTHYLKDDFLVDIINNGKWKPNVDSLKDFYIINELILTSRIDVSLCNAATGGAGARVDLNLPNPVEAGFTYSQGADGSLSIHGVEENGYRKPFPIAFRTAHVVYKDNFKLKRMMKLDVRRGDDDGHHLSGFVQKNEKYHIGEFFLNTDEEDGPTVVPVSFDEDSELAVAQEL